jgi:hypothetical protein
MGSASTLRSPPCNPTTSLISLGLIYRICLHRMDTVVLPVSAELRIHEAYMAPIDTHFTSFTASGNVYDVDSGASSLNHHLACLQSGVLERPNTIGLSVTSCPL